MKPSIPQPRRGARQGLGAGALLLAVTVWGGSFVVVQDGLATVALFHFLFLRFLLAAVILVPLAARRGQLVSVASQPLPWILGALLFAGLTLQSGALLSTTPTRSAFLTSLSVIIVPFLAWLATGRRPSAPKWCAAVLATAGLLAIYTGGEVSWGRGDVLALLCALAFAGHVLVGQVVARTSDVVGAVAVQAVCCTAFSLCALPLEGSARLVPTDADALLAIAYAGCLATALAFGLQLFAQRTIGAVETGVLLALEPLAAAVISIGLGRENLEVGVAIGGTLLIAAAILAERANDGHGAPPAPGVRRPGGVGEPP